MQAFGTGGMMMRLNKKMKKYSFRNKKTVKHIAILMLSILLLTELCGCSLASKEEGAKESRDELIGAIVTKEPIEKTYADFEWSKPVNANTYPTRITFEGITGQFFYAYESKMSGQDEKSSFWDKGDHIQTAINMINEDDKRIVKLKADIFFVVEKPGEIVKFYLNPVYMTSDKMKIYAAPGQGTPGIKVDGLKGITMGDTLSFKEVHKRTLLDQTTIDSFEIEANLYPMDKPLHIWLTHMTKDHQVIKKEEYISVYDRTKDTGYEANTEYGSVRTEPGTAYILMEQELLKPNGSTVIERQILDWDGFMTNDWDEEGREFERKATLLETYYIVTEGYLAKELAIICWPLEE
ncbi:MAG: hypothetical protein E7253_07595 [Lachnospiraceae bacterium]|nr:hypothetical protein [Lachnospiraceae bacterium]